MIALTLSLALTQASALPPSFYEASEFLLAHGLADTKGGELRHVKIWIPRRNNSGTEGPIKSVGFVMPATQGKKPMAVGNDGLVYSVAEVGEAVTTDELMKGAELRLPSAERPIKFDTATPLFIVLLHRNGQTETARALWNADYRRPRYLQESLYEDFVGGLYTRSFMAYEAGKLEVSAWDSGIFVANEKAYRDEITRLHSLKGVTDPLRDFLLRFTFMDALHKEATRRLADKKPELDLAQNRTLPADKQVANIIEALDQAKNFGPGDSNWRGLGIEYHPYVEELVKIGDPAIEPLIRTCADDKRLTLGVETAQSAAVATNNGGRIVPVWKLAAAALERILLKPGVRGTETQAETARQYKEHWERVGREGRVDRLLTMLSDETPQRALNAAKALTEGPNPAQSWTPGQKIKFIAWIHERTKKSIDESKAAKKGSHQQGYLFANYGGLVDPVEVLPSLQLVCRTIAKDSARIEALGTGHYMKPQLAMLTSHRLRAGDRTAVDDYLEGMKRPFEERFYNRGLENAFQPLIVAPNIPEFRAFGKKAFAKGGPWDMRGRIRDFHDGAVSSRLLLIPPSTTW